jgi:PRC-barrel domain
MSVRQILLATTLAVAFAVPAMAQTTAPTQTQPTTPTPLAPATPSLQPTTPSMNAPGPVTDMFYSGSWMPTHWHASDAMGQAVYNRANEKVGDVEELLIDGEGRIIAAVVGVGGFLGMGERKVAVTYRSFQMTREANSKPKLVVDVTKATLMNAPEYKATDAMKRS